jgi:hypothetical protein
MKNHITSLGFIALTTFCSNAFADNVMMTETKSWQNVPVTVDTTKNTYTVTGTVPTGATQYYYSYPGYRCFKTKKTYSGNPVTFNAADTSGSSIYCYSEK